MAIRLLRINLKVKHRSNRWSTALAMLFLGIAFFVAAVPQAQAETSTPVHPNHSTLPTSRTCSKDYESSHTFWLGVVRHTENVSIGTQPTGTWYRRLRQGTKVVIGAESGTLLCIGDYYEGNPIGWIPSASIVRIPRPAVLGGDAWSGVWTNFGGSWLAIRAGAAQATIVEGRACWAYCFSFSALDDVRSSGKFESPMTALGSTLSFTSGGEDDPCRFTATLASESLMIVNNEIQSDEHQWCGGMNVSWRGGYFKVAPYPVEPYPPYARMKAYFSALGIPFMTLPEQQSMKKCNNDPYDICPSKPDKKSMSQYFFVPNHARRH